MMERKLKAPWHDGERKLHPVWHEYAHAMAHHDATEHAFEGIHGDNPVDVYLTHYRYKYGQHYIRAQNANTIDIGIHPRCHDKAGSDIWWNTIVPNYHLL